MRNMAKKGSIPVDNNFVGADLCFKNGYVHKVYNSNEIEKYIFASPIHEWYVLQSWFLVVCY